MALVAVEDAVRIAAGRAGIGNGQKLISAARERKDL
jgi:hypothetical protein